MTREEVVQIIGNTLRQVFGDKNIIVTSSTSAKDISDWDSLNHITIISSIERAFKLKFSLSEITKLQNVGDMADLILVKLSK